MTEVRTHTPAADGVLQFGTAAGPSPDRRAAFGVLEQDGRLAVVHIQRATGEPAYHDLPGGGVDPGETDEQAVLREFGEETGLRVRVTALLGRASQFTVLENGEPANNRSALFALALEGEDAALKVEDDHALQWLGADRAVVDLRHDSHAWAVALWMRRQGRAR